MKKIILGFSILVWSLAVYGQTTAQKLGYGPNDKLIIVHADDIGMSHSVNTASIEAFKHNMVTSGSIMVPCPWFPEIADYAKQHPELDLGIHLTLTSEWKYLRWRPVAPIDKVPGLLDEQGFMWKSERQTAMQATPQEIETELRAQIDRALAFGIKPTHLDTHMGTLYTRQDFFCRVRETWQGIWPPDYGHASDARSDGFCEKRWLSDHSGNAHQTGTGWLSRPGLSGHRGDW